MNNQDILARSLRAVWHPCTQMKQHETLPLVPIARGEGVWLVDFDGKRYLDAVSSWWVNLFGHCNPRINAALKDQLDRLEHVILAGFTHQPVVELSERLSRLSGLGHCFYGSDGASATEIALKMSFHYWRNAGRPQKTRFVSLQNGYHGETVGALSVTDVALFKDTYAPLLRPSAQVPSPDWRLAEAGESARDYALRCAVALRAHLERHHAETAALIVEPLVQGAAGMGMYDPEYLRQARALCDEFEVHLIADEIAVGFGRTGTMFAWEQAFAAPSPQPLSHKWERGYHSPLPLVGEGQGERVRERAITPDFLCLSKGITGGYLPLSAVLTTEPVYRAFYHDETARGFLHSHSYTGNALACRAALATLDIFEQDGVIEANRAKTAFFNQAAAPLEAHPRVKNFRNRGMIWAFEVADAAPGFARQFFEAGLQRGLLLRPIGNTVYFMPPYVIGEEEFRMLVSGTLEILENM
ncbi:MAG: aminotransferase class III-fold pyridoxal phosphate-dependent enzyme [Sulfuricella sp.]|nr:aminotransferase class III-fold pyridoxal phosphate-dependent enzyme [Sulfuricella sp.]